MSRQNYPYSEGGGIAPLLNCIDVFFVLPLSSAERKQDCMGILKKGTILATLWHVVHQNGVARAQIVGKHGSTCRVKGRYVDVFLLAFPNKR